MQPTTEACPHLTSPAHKYVLGQIMLAELALQISGIGISPLSCQIMSTRNRFMVIGWHDKPVKNVRSPICAVPVNSPWVIIHGDDSVLIPMWAFACLPDISTDITELTSASSIQLAFHRCDCRDEAKGLLTDR